MKKSISFLLAFCLALGAFAFVSFASNKEHSVNRTVSSVGNITECKYDAQTGKINVVGNVDHDFLINHSKYNLSLYALPFGCDHIEYLSSDKAVALTKSDISVKFDFSVNAETNAEKFSEYCVVAENEEGNMIPLGVPKLPSVESKENFLAGDKTSVKGIESSLTSLAVESGASSTIVPVYLNKLLSNASVGHLYSLHESYIYFDSAYISQLDARIRSLMATGGAVYIRFLLEDGAESFVSGMGASCIPDMSSQQNMDLVVAFTDFLCTRYNDRYAGTIRGIILGSEVDEAYERSDVASVSDYAKNYFRYMTVVSSSANQISPNIDVVLPFGNVDSYTTENIVGVCSPSTLLETVCFMLDNKFVEPFNFSALIDTDVIPYGLSDKTLASGVLKPNGDGLLSADSVRVFSDYLRSLRTKYKNAPDGYIFVWNVSERLSYNVLSTAYAYSYFKLLSDDMLISFVASFDAAEAKGDHDSLALISELVGKIDTSECFEATKPQLKLLRANSWYEVVANMYGGELGMKKTHKLSVLDRLSEKIIGSYAYFDFAYQTDTASWFGGSYCDKLNVDYSDVSGRALKAHFAGAFASPSEYSELYCAYEYEENLVFTPYVALNFSIENDAKDKNALYELKVAFGSKSFKSTASTVCAPYENVELLFDFHEFVENSNVEYITISVRCLSGKEGGYTLCVESLDGYSDKHLSDDLSSLIAEERLRIQNLKKDDVSVQSGGMNRFVVISGVVAVVFVIGVGIFMCFKREDAEEEE